MVLCIAISVDDDADVSLSIIHSLKGLGMPSSLHMALALSLSPSLGNPLPPLPVPQLFGFCQGSSSHASSSSISQVLVPLPLFLDCPLDHQAITLMRCPQGEHKGWPSLQQPTLQSCIMYVCFEWNASVHATHHQPSQALNQTFSSLYRLA